MDEWGIWIDGCQEQLLEAVQIPTASWGLHREGWGESLLNTHQRSQQCDGNVGNRFISSDLTGGTDLVQDLLSDRLEAHHSPHVRHKGAVPGEGLDLIQKESVVDQHPLEVGGAPEEGGEALKSDFRTSRCDGLHSWGAVENVGDVTKVALEQGGEGLKYKIGVLCI